MGSPTERAPIDPADPHGDPHGEQPGTGSRRTHPAAPPWYPPAAGLWACALLVTVLDAPGRPAVLVVGAIVVVSGGVLLRRWYQRRGIPSLRGAPRRVREPFHTFFLSLGVALCVVVAAARSLPQSVALGMCFVVVAVAVVLHERVYRRAVDSLREPGG